jgi:hypothetical protein
MAGACLTSCSPYSRGFAAFSLAQRLLDKAPREKVRLEGRKFLYVYKPIADMAGIAVHGSREPTSSYQLGFVLV